MSERTPCNLCSVHRIMRENPGKDVVVQVEFAPPTGFKPMLEVLVDGKPIGVKLAALTLYCAC